MKVVACFLGLILSGYSTAQSMVFITRAQEIVQQIDVTETIEDLSPTGEEYNILSRGKEDLEALFVGALKKNSRARPDELKMSQTLNSLSMLATQSWKGSQYGDAKKWGKLKKYFNRAAARSTTRFNLMKEMSFRISLVDNHGRKFYCDRKGAEDALNLYYGKLSNSTSKDDEVVEEPEPLNFFSDAVMVEKFMQQIRKKHVLSDLRKGNFAYVGLSVEIDESTLHCNRIPTARIVVVLGARRLKNLKIKSGSTKPQEVSPSSI